MSIFNSVYKSVNHKIAYFPFEWNEIDKWANQLSMTKNRTISYTTLSSWKVVANFQSATLYSDNTFCSLLTDGYTVSFRYTVNKNSNNRRNQFVIWTTPSWMECWITTLETNSWWATQLYYNWYSGWVWSTAHSWWLHCAIVVTNHNTINVYINWSLYITHSTSQGTWILGIWYAWWSWDYHNWYMSEFMVEDIARTADEISKYYNWTKSLY